MIIGIRKKFESEFISKQNANTKEDIAELFYTRDAIKNSDHVLSWGKENLSNLCVVDIDTHKKGMKLEIQDILKIYPSPELLQSSKSGGFHLMYVGERAFQRACVAKASAGQLNISGVDLLHEVTIYGGFYMYKGNNELTKNNMEFKFSNIQMRISRELNQDPGEKRERQRLPRNMCPYRCGGEDPSIVNSPVIALEEGIYCHKCRKFTPYTLIDNKGRAVFRTPNTMPLILAIKKWYHYDLLRLIISRYLPDNLEFEETEIRAILRYLMFTYRGVHPDNESCLQELNLYRSESNVWADKYGLPLEKDVVKDRMKNSPLVWDHDRLYKVKDGEPTDIFIPGPKRIDPVKMSNMCATGSLNEDLISVEYVQGYNLAPTIKNLYSMHFVKEVPARDEFHKEIQLKDTPLDIMEAFRRFDEYLNDKPLPKLNVMMLIAAIIFAGRKGYCEKPGLICTGVSGAGKTSIPRIVNAMLRVPDPYILDDYNIKNMKLLVGEAILNNNPLVILDEALKEPNPRHFFNLLNPYIDFREMYVGNVKAVNRSVILLTGINIPDNYKSEQMRRRYITMPKLYNNTEWQILSIDKIVEDTRLKEASDAVILFARRLGGLLHPNTTRFKEYWNIVEQFLKKHYPELLIAEVDDKSIDMDGDDGQEEIQEDNLVEMLSLIVEHAKISTSNRQGLYKAFIVDMEDRSRKHNEEFYNKFTHIDWEKRKGIPIEVLDFFMERSVGLDIHMKRCGLKIYFQVKSGNKYPSKEKLLNFLQNRS